MQLNNENGPIIYDVLTYVKHPKYGGIYLNIEAQKGRVSYPIGNRMTIYRAYGITMQNQGNMNQFYRELKPFISIWIFLDVPKKYENTIKVDHLYEETLFGKRKMFDVDYGIMKAVKIYLGNEINTENNCLALLGTLFSMKLSYEEKIKKLNEIDPEFLDEEIEKEVNTMCNLGELLQEESIMNATFKNAISIVEEFHIDFKKALIVLKITDPKEQEVYLKKYETLKTN